MNQVAKSLLILMFGTTLLSTGDLRLVLADPLGNESTSDQSAGEELFVRRIWPLLNQRCLACHGDQADGGLDLRSAARLIAGGDSGRPTIDRDAPLSSPLLAAISNGASGWSLMPPKESDRLSSEQIGWVRQWVIAGAPWPEAPRIAEINAANADRWSTEDGAQLKTSGGQSQSWTERRYREESLWGYRPVVRPNIDESGSQAVDRLISDAMPEGLMVAPQAERLTLIRRASFDLLGLPPTPAEVDEFVNDPADDARAFANLVERLLDSPHYGERMAQHWLDVVRYADSSGFANDYERGNAWRYRDYVVRSFNRDKPYHQFVTEQIAGDEIAPENSEMLIATGFLRMGPWELTAMEVAKIARQRFLDDVTNSVGESFLAQSLQCARCHDHKFDPVPTRDYYAIQAVFATTQLAEPAATFLPDENTSGFEQRRYLTAQQNRHQETLARLDAQLLSSAQQWFVEQHIDPSAWNAAVNKTTAQTGAQFTAVRSGLLKAGFAEDQLPPKLYGFSAEDFGNERVARKGLERLNWELDRYEPYALAVYSGRTPQMNSVNRPLRIPSDRTSSGELEQGCILIGGDPFAPGDAVKPGILSVLNDGKPFPIPTAIDGRRTAFAQWVASASNPLTTRAIVNRIWQWHFGNAIARNPNNFGSTGSPPTHPELLDFLAAALVEHNGSIKSMHRIIMNSEAYRRSSSHSAIDSLRVSDPLATRYAVFKPRRLSAEELRDAMLVASGELNRMLGGIPSRPEINLEAALQPRQVMGTFASAWVPDPLPHQRHRRSLYSLKLRGLVDPSLEAFNTPSPDFSCERRDSSTVTPQALSLFNGQSTHSRALAMAADVLQKSVSKEDAVNKIFLRTFARQPTLDELATCIHHWDDRMPLVSTTPPSTSPPPREVIREAVEENTGETFTFVERLYAYDDFVPDLRPEDTGANVRALADVCVVLFNTNEFIYVY